MGSLAPRCEKMPPEKLKIIGTAHVSQPSVEEVRKAILEGLPDVVAVELDPNRYYSLMNEKKWYCRRE